MSRFRIAYDQCRKSGVSGANYSRSHVDIPDRGHPFRAITATGYLQRGIESVPASRLPHRSLKLDKIGYRDWLPGLEGEIRGDSGQDGVSAFPIACRMTQGVDFIGRVE